LGSEITKLKEEYQQLKTNPITTNSQTTTTTSPTKNSEPQVKANNNHILSSPSRKEEIVPSSDEDGLEDFLNRKKLEDGEEEYDDF
jgi:hypothetical protein